jgi:hypothetical protein
MKAIANRNPPLPWFHDKLKLSGYAAREKIIGLVSKSVTAMLEFRPKILDCWLDAGRLEEEAPLSSLNDNVPVFCYL